MRRSFFLLLVPAFFLFSCGKRKDTGGVAYAWEVPVTPFDFAKYVDPLIGTDGHGHTFPGATAPFGMVQLSPDTRVDDSWDGCSGYHYSDSVIYGFSHTHLSGTGCSDYGDILLMPGAGPVRFNNGADGKPGYGSRFDHKNEKASAGYYSVVLDNSGIQAELTASPRVGVHRYSMPAGSEPWILVDLQHRDEVLDSYLEIVNDSTIRGYRFSKAWAADQRLWFYAEFSEPFTAHEFEKNAGAGSLRGKQVKCVFHFRTDRPVVVKVALSPVSMENAQLNLGAEVPGWDFETVRKKVAQQWNNELGKIEVVSDDERQKRTFYTALYHCFIAPNLYCDVNGDYRGMDQQVHRDAEHPQYTVFSLWDTYRALHPLFTIIQPKRDQDFIRTFLKQYQQGGRLPVWELSANETNCMIGYHAVPVIVDAWMKGLTDFDTALAYEAMKRSAMSDERGLKEYRQYGFIPAEGESESVSKTLEYAYDDWCIAQAARRMNRQDDYHYFIRRSQNWRNLFDPKTGFMRARLNNAFVSPFDPGEVNFHYTEANAWQYSLAVPQNITGLIAATGRDSFVTHLNRLFSAPAKTSGREQADITGMVGQYAQGNEPSHHMAYLYDYAGEPWKTQELVSRICRELYTDQPDGLCGNEDCGQTSAWYVFSSIGFYPVTPGLPVFALGSPQFREVRFHLENGKIYTLKATGAGPTKPYVIDRLAVSLGEGNNTIYYSTILKGGKDALVMDDNTQMKPLPFFPIRDSLSYIPEVPLVFAAHDLANEKTGDGCARTFTGAMRVILGVPDHRGRMMISANDGSFTAANDTLVLQETSRLRAFTLGVDGFSSDTVSFAYTKIPPGRNIRLLTSYRNQYAAGGDYALIDGIRGPENFRTGSWQGYEGNNLEAIVDLGSRKEITTVSIGFLQDQGAWIFLPDEVRFYVSDDGKNFTALETLASTIDPKQTGVVRHDFSSERRAKARYIKVIAKNRGVCPEWHPGRGKACWIFADEIMIETK